MLTLQHILYLIDIKGNSNGHRSTSILVSKVQLATLIASFVQYHMTWKILWLYTGQRHPDQLQCVSTYTVSHIYILHIDSTIPLVSYTWKFQELTYSLLNSLTLALNDDNWIVAVLNRVFIVLYIVCIMAIFIYSHTKQQGFTLVVNGVTQRTSLFKNRCLHKCQPMNGVSLRYE